MLGPSCKQARLGRAVDAWDVQTRAVADVLGETVDKMSANGLTEVGWPEVRPDGNTLISSDAAILVDSVDPNWFSSELLILKRLFKKIFFDIIFSENTRIPIGLTLANNLIQPGLVSEDVRKTLGWLPAVIRLDALCAEHLQRWSCDDKTLSSNTHRQRSRSHQSFLYLNSPDSPGHVGTIETDYDLDAWDIPWVDKLYYPTSSRRRDLLAEGVCVLRCKTYCKWPTRIRLGNPGFDKAGRISPIRLKRSESGPARCVIRMDPPPGRGPGESTGFDSIRPDSPDPPRSDMPPALKIRPTPCESRLCSLDSQTHSSARKKTEGVLQLQDFFSAVADRKSGRWLRDLESGGRWETKKNLCSHFSQQETNRGGRWLCFHGKSSTMTMSLCFHSGKPTVVAASCQATKIVKEKQSGNRSDPAWKYGEQIDVPQAGKDKEIVEEEEACFDDGSDEGTNQDDEQIRYMDDKISKFPNTQIYKKKPLIYEIPKIPKKMGSDGSPIGDPPAVGWAPMGAPLESTQWGIGCMDGKVGRSGLESAD
ncbi:hypothetical protein Taro_027684 [Colocasia esculenta]|uniref:Uncharacterized protein n=1 Tax=Colocasia esculenta TaxID=4460 RepID=A0A843VV10_COLES|nr:hypothetical protein [Colocasia esculenta]